LPSTLRATQRPDLGLPDAHDDRLDGTHEGAFRFVLPAPPCATSHADPAEADWTILAVRATTAGYRPLAGAKVRDVTDDAGYFAVMQDPEGNEFCVG
jgi:hypothetical protein